MSNSQLLLNKVQLHEIYYYLQLNRILEERLVSLYRTGKVVGGKVVLEGVSLEEGTSVTVLAKDDDGSLELTPEQEAGLLLSIAEADRGETVSAEEVLAKLVHRRG